MNFGKLLGMLSWKLEKPKTASRHCILRRSWILNLFYNTLNNSGRELPVSASNITPQQATARSNTPINTKMCLHYRVSALRVITLSFLELTYAHQWDWNPPRFTHKTKNNSPHSRTVSAPLTTSKQTLFFVVYLTVSDEFVRQSELGWKC